MAMQLTGELPFGDKHGAHHIMASPGRIVDDALRRLINISDQHSDWVRIGKTDTVMCTSCTVNLACCLLFLPRWPTNMYSWPCLTLLCI